MATCLKDVNSLKKNQRKKSRTHRYRSAPGRKGLGVLRRKEARARTRSLVAFVAGTALFATAIATVHRVDGPARAEALTSPVQIELGSASVVEGDSATRVLAIPVTLTRQATVAVSASYSLVGVTATAGSDFNAKTGTVRFPLNKQGITPVLQFINVTILSDRVLEPDETFEVRLAQPVGGSLRRDRAASQILDDDSSSTRGAGVGGLSVFEGASGPKRIVKALVTLPAKAVTTTTIRYAVSPQTARKDVDYTATASGTLTFNEGQIQKNISISVYPDTDDVASETLAVTLSSPSGTTLGRASATVTLLQSAGSTVVFSDDFTSTTLGSAWYPNRWFADTCAPGATGSELAHYRGSNVSVANGSLTLTALAASNTCSEWPEDGALPYTSGWAQTGGARTKTKTIAPGFAFTYGRVDIRFRAPAGAGLWPAFWLMPVGTNQSYPSRPEIDILEQRGDQPTRWQMAVHLPGGIDKTTTYTGPNTTTGFHIVSLDWRPQALIWLVDGAVVWTYTGKAIPSDPMYLITNLAVSGSAGTPTG